MLRSLVGSEMCIRDSHNVHLINSNSEIVSKTLALLKEGDILITMGAGNIWQYGEEILRQLKNYVDTNHKQ